MDTTTTPNPETPDTLGLAGLTVDSASRRFRAAIEQRMGRREADAVTRLVWHSLKGWDTQQTFMHADDPVSDFIASKLNAIHNRLENDEPIQYILGEAYFYGMDMKVTRATLIPRPETEELADMVVQENKGDDLRVLDACTGSGAIAIALARNLPFADVTAIDISAPALAVARANAEKLRARIDFVETDILTYDPPEDEFDIIVSNPPYVDESEKSGMEANVLRWEPATALFVPDDDPLRFYKALAKIAVKGLKSGGRLYLEINPRHAEALADMLTAGGLAEVRIVRDAHGKKRFATAFKR